MVELTLTFTRTTVIANIKMFTTFEKNNLNLTIMKPLIFTTALFIVTAMYAQVGVGNETPRGMLDVNDNPSGNATMGLVLPHADDVTTLENPETDANVGGIRNTLPLIRLMTASNSLKTTILGLSVSLQEVPLQEVQEEDRA